MKKKITSIVLLAAMLNTCAQAAVIDSVSQDSKSGIITVTGTGLASGEDVTIEMFDANEDSESYRSKPEFIGVFTADGNGAYHAEFGAPYSAESGNKEIYAKPFIMNGESKNLSYYSAKALESVISEWNNAVESGSEEIMTKLINSVESVKILFNSLIAEDVFNELKDADKSALAKKLIETGKTDSIEDASKKFLPLYTDFAISRLSPETCAELTAEFYDIIDTQKGDIFTDIISKMTDKERNVLYTSAAKRISGNISKEEFTQLIYEEAVMAKLKSIEYYGDIHPFMQKYNEDYFKLNFSEYNNLKNTYPVDSKVISQNALYKNFSELGTLFNGWVSSQKSEEAKNTNQSGGSSGGSGGGGASGGSPKTNYSPVIPVTETIAEEKAFNDLAGYEWAEEYIMRLYGKNVVNGTEKGMFSPGGSVTREQFIKLLSAVTELTEGEEASGFEDVKPGEWYENYINAAKKAGIVKGVSETEFGIGQKITRQDAAVMMLNAIKLYNGSLLDGIDTDSIDFADSEDISSYAMYSVAALSRLEIVNGMNDGKFYPQSYTSRAEAAVMIGRILELIG